VIETKNAADRWKADPTRPNLVLTEGGEVVMVTATAGEQGRLASRNALLAAAAPDLLDAAQRCYARSNAELLGLRGELQGSGVADAEYAGVLRDRIADEEKHAEYLRGRIAAALGVS